MRWWCWWRRLVRFVLWEAFMVYIILCHKWNDDVWNSISKQWSSSPIILYTFFLFSFWQNKIEFAKFLAGYLFCVLCPWIFIMEMFAYIYYTCSLITVKEKMVHQNNFTALWFFIFIIKCVVLWCLMMVRSYVVFIRGRWDIL